MHLNACTPLFSVIYYVHEIKIPQDLEQKK